MSDQRNLLIAVVLSMLVVFGWQYLVGVPKMQQEQAKQAQSLQQQKLAPTAQPGAAAVAPARTQNSRQPRPPRVYVRAAPTSETVAPPCRTNRSNSLTMSATSRARSSGVSCAGKLGAERITFAGDPTARLPGGISRA